MSSTNTQPMQNQEIEAHELNLALSERCTITVSDRITNTQGHKRSLGQVIQGIRQGEFEKWSFANRIATIRNVDTSQQKRDLTKSTLPWFSMAEFDGTRCAANTKQSWGIVLDIDHVGTDEAIEICKSELIAIPCVKYVFRSPNDGVKAIVLFDEPVTEKDEYSQIFNYCANYILDATGYKVDPTCKDICRIHFFSHDPRLREDKFAAPLSVREALAMSQEVALQERVLGVINLTSNIMHQIETINYNYNDPSQTIVYPSSLELDLQKAAQIIEVLNSCVIDYLDWIKVGLALKNVFAEEGLGLWLRFSGNPNYNDTEDSLARKWYSFPSQNSCNFGSIIYVGEKHGYQK
ncbi:MAG: hypothetical protein CVU48_04530 [Candidatus Cloacimonetes bacterium HGW-Cloacimonetes-1]|jgi:hypothetical protein|nr:MAG: hypothetical protein CVU48_04530 [Candidatus Cloacimonetes bacterium HGW-Cloacimonetes-1]